MNQPIRPIRQAHGKQAPAFAEASADAKALADRSAGRQGEKGISILAVIGILAVLVVVGVGGYFLGRGFVPTAPTPTTQIVSTPQPSQPDLSSQFENFSLYQPSRFIFGTTPRGQVYPAGGRCSGDHLRRYVEIISKVDAGSKKQLQLFGTGGSGQNAILLVTDNYYKLNPSEFISYNWGTEFTPPSWSTDLAYGFHDDSFLLDPGCYDVYAKPLYAHPDKLIWQLSSCALPVPEEGFSPTQSDFVEYRQCRAIENQIRDYFDKKLFDYLAPGL